MGRQERIEREQEDSPQDTTTDIQPGDDTKSPNSDPASKPKNPSEGQPQTQNDDQTKFPSTSDPKTPEDPTADQSNLPQDPQSSESTSESGSPSVPVEPTNTLGGFGLPIPAD